MAATLSLSFQKEKKLVDVSKVDKVAVFSTLSWDKDDSRLQKQSKSKTNRYKHKYKKKIDVGF